MSIAASVDDLPDLNAPEWFKMFGNSAYQYPFHELSKDNEKEPEEVPSDGHRNLVDHAIEAMMPATPLPVTPPASMSPPAWLSPSKMEYWCLIHH